MMLRMGRVHCFLAIAVSLLGLARAHAGTSNSLMDVTPDGKWLLVANADNGTATLVDTAQRRAVREIKVGEKPEGVAWIGGGPLALVTVYREDRLVVVNASTGQVVHRQAVPDEPYGVVVNKSGTRAWVTHEYPGVVTEFGLEGLASGQPPSLLRTLSVTPFIRGMALSSDEKTLYVTGYYNAILYAIDLDSGKVVDEWRGQTRDNLARNVVLHPRRPKAFMPHIRSRIEATEGAGSIFPEVSIMDLVPPSVEKRRKTIGMDTFNNLTPPTNPWEAAFAPDGKRFYVVYAGTNDMNICQVIDDDNAEIERQGNITRIGQNPRAVRVSPDGQFVYISNTLDFEIGVYDAANMRSLAKIKVCDPPKTPEWVRGKALFSTALPPLTSRRWIACASCHPDGNHDGRTWHNPEGLRRTTALFGMAHTHPLHWSADRDEAQDFEYTIRSQLMQGRGLVQGSLKPKPGHAPTELEEKLTGRSADLDALALYCNTFEFTLSPHIPAPGKLSEAAERGRAIFFSKEAGCASCHSSPYYSDSCQQKPYLLHEVGTGGDDPSEKMGSKYDTPTLLGVYRLTAYLHHGKAKSLTDVLTTFNQGDRHGKTSHLEPAEVADLVEFLKSLPYEPPPKETANTIK